MANALYATVERCEFRQLHRSSISIQPTWSTSKVSISLDAVVSTGTPGERSGDQPPGGRVGSGGTPKAAGRATRSVPVPRQGGDCGGSVRPVRLADGAGTRDPGGAHHGAAGGGGA